ncbi:Hypothetical_protein [Hexamita inflata]|uniref:Hypothetical_protein n=1 Tax=Hexamita inflata TaxID=28002 RepID=A0AA86PFD8_9EUKA|nr:Hypothetical protein HINF_LOCUS1920 [Hexamita inflata]CAI9934697.1 Hypothetical protein HINF_LOCUS22342 [Hexamita inflata]
MNIRTRASQSMSSLSSKVNFTYGREMNSAKGIILVNVRTVLFAPCTRIATDAITMFYFKYCANSKNGLELGTSKQGSQFSKPVLNIIFPSFNVAFNTISEEQERESKLYQQSATAVIAPIVDFMSYSRLRRTLRVKSENIVPTIIYTASRSSSEYLELSLTDVGSRRYRVIWRKSVFESLWSPMI